MDCPSCKARNPDAAVRCLRCATALPIDGRTVENTANSALTLDVDFANAWSDAPGDPGNERGALLQSQLTPGTLLCDRYEIRELLGMGGMGAVYKAWDRPLDRFVAIKTIRPDLAADSNSLRRFKQELILARQVTHRNVIRIFDIGEHQGIKFISMEFVDGSNLNFKMKVAGRVGVEESVQIVQQICWALDAAHSVGVVHRDLKPHNIMVDSHGRLVVMDFGIARSVSMPGLTAVGAIVGTPEYMSPEQAVGDTIDSRTDIFSLGIIAYELLTGKKPFPDGKGESGMFHRLSDRAPLICEAEPAVPVALGDIVARCLEPDPKNRYQFASELAGDLDRWQRSRSQAKSEATAAPALHSSPSRRGLAAIAMVILLLGITGFILRANRRFAWFGDVDKTSAMLEQDSLAIFPFHNDSGDPGLDWLGTTMSQRLTEGVGQSKRLRTVAPDRAAQISGDLGLTQASNFDQRTLERLAGYASANRIVSGRFNKSAGGFHIEAAIFDTKTAGHVYLKKELTGTSELLPAIDDLAREIRGHLGLSADAITDLDSGAIKASSTSLTALRDYYQGLVFVRDGNSPKAVEQFLLASNEDLNFALAFSRLSETYALLGQDELAATASRKAIELSQALPIQERSLISASHSRIMKDYRAAIASYEGLAVVRPGDTDVLLHLAELHEELGDYDKAGEYFAKVLSNDPKCVDALLAQGRVNIEKGDPAKGLEYLDSALAIQPNRDEQRANVLQAMGVAYQTLNRLPEALQSFEASLAIKRGLGLKSGMASSLSAIAQVHEAMGSPQLALRGYTEALRLLRETGDKARAAGVMNDLGNFYNDRGEYNKALALFKEYLKTQIELGNEQSQGLALNNIGYAYLSKGDYEDAHTYLVEALQRREKFQDENDIADTLHNLGETSTNLGLLDDAVAQYLRALQLRRKLRDQRGEAIENYSLGVVFALKGRFGAAMSAQLEALKAFNESGGKGIWLAYNLAGYGSILSRLGKSGDANKQLDEALQLARELRNQNLVARIIGLQGNDAFYRDDFTAARAFYQQAFAIASQTTDRQLRLTSEFDLAKLSIEEGKEDKERIFSLRAVRNEASTAGLRYLALECSWYLAKSMIRSKQNTQARAELQRALLAGEKMGADELVMRCHFLLGEAASGMGEKTESRLELDEASRMFAAIQQEAHADFGGRKDLHQLRYAQN